MMPLVLAIKDRVNAARLVNFHESLVIRVSPSDELSMSVIFELVFNGLPSRSRVDHRPT
jgi:hypothetical protein